MTTPIDHIREALAALPAEALKPWRQLDKLPYLHATDDPNATPWGTPVIGRFDYMETMRYIAACNPSAMSAVLAEIEALKADAERYRWLKAHGYYDHAEDVAHIDEQIALAQCQNCLGTRAPNALDPEWKGRCECAEAAEQAEQHEEINGRPAPDAALKEPS